MSEQPLVKSDVIISTRGGANPRMVSVSGLICTWEINAAGQFSALAPLRDVLNAGFDPDLRGCWLDYTHGSAGRWAGVVTASPATDGLVEIVGQGFEVLLKKRLVTLGEQTLAPGTLFLQAYGDAANAGTTFLTMGPVDQSGPGITASWTSADFYDSVAPQLTIDSGFEWKVTNDRIIYFQRRLGADKTANVELAHGREVLSSRWTFDQFPLVNEIVAVGAGMRRDAIKGKKKKGKKKKKRKITYVDSAFALPAIRVYNQASINRYGPFEVDRDYGQVGDAAGLERAARAELATYTDALVDAVELTIADVGGAFGKFVEGDTISVNLGLSGIAGRMRVMVRTLDVQAGTLQIAGVGDRY